MTDTVVIPLPGRQPAIEGGRLQRADAETRDPQPFLAGPENHLVEPAVEGILNDARPRYNPVVFFGPSGTGKSHLAQGLYEVWHERFGRRRRGEYLTAVDFAREQTDAIARQAVDDFRQRFRTAALLVLDDVGRLSNKPAAQEELIYTLDTLLAAGGRAVLTIGTAPEVQPDLLPGLRARLVSGLTVPLALPAAGTRRILLGQFARGQGIELSDTAATLLAEGMVATAPELLGAVIQLGLDGDGAPRRVTAEAARRMLRERAQRKAPSLAALTAATARHFGLRVADLRGPSRQRAVVQARDVTIALARELTLASLEQIGKYLGGRDHTTIMHSCRKMDALRGSDPATAKVYEELRGHWLEKVE